jgi:hypothetical protein
VSGCVRARRLSRNVSRKRASILETRIDSDRWWSLILQQSISISILRKICNKPNPMQPQLFVPFIDMKSCKACRQLKAHEQAIIRISSATGRGEWVDKESGARPASRHRVYMRSVSIDRVDTIMHEIRANESTNKRAVLTIARIGVFEGRLNPTPLITLGDLRPALFISGTLHRQDLEFLDSHACWRYSTSIEVNNPCSHLVEPFTIWCGAGNMKVCAARTYCEETHDLRQTRFTTFEFKCDMQMTGCSMVSDRET